MKTFQSTAKRPVYVNDIYCESMMAAAVEASRITKTDVKKWEIQRVLDGKIKLPEIEISEKIPEKHKVLPKQRGLALLKYPKGERPIDRGLPAQWK